MDGAETDEPAGILFTGLPDKIVDAHHLLGSGGDGLHQEPVHSGPVSGFKKGLHAAHGLHGNGIEFPNAVRGLFRDFVGVNVGVHINNLHGTFLPF